MDGTRSDDLTRIAIEGRRQITAILKFLRKYVKGCENVRLMASAALPGVRETRKASKYGDAFPIHPQGVWVYDAHRTPREGSRHGS